MGLFSSKIPMKRLASLTRSLLALYKGGIPIVRGLELLAAQPGQRTLRSILTRMADTIRQGGTLGKAVRAESRYFPRLFIETVDSGDRTGTLADVLELVAGYYEEMIVIRGMYLRAMAYPLAVLFAAVYVIPYFTGLWFTDKSVELYTLLFVWRSVLSILPTLILLVVLARTGVLKFIWHVLSWHVWPFTSFGLKLSFAHYFRTLSILHGSGMLPVKAVERSAAVVDNPLIRMDLKVVVPAIQRGDSWEVAFKAMSRLPGFAYNTIVTGERSGKMDDSLEVVARWYFDEAYHTFKKVAIGMMAMGILMLVALNFLMQIVGLILAIIRSVLGAF
ncbi:MAG: hypothetical protein GY851_01820 [bacterium]|nr:hypothetical protein [bacterium]